MSILIKQEFYKLFRRRDIHIYNLFLAAITIFAAFYQKNNGTDGFFFIFHLGIQVPLAIILFTIIMASTIIAGEFSNDTIKTLLARRYSRLQIFMSKIIIIFFYYIQAIIVTLIAAIAGSMFFLKFNKFPHEAWNWLGTTIEENSIFLLLLISLVILVSYIAKSSGAAIGLGVAALFGSQIIQAIAINFIPRYEWLKWTPLNFFLTNYQITSGALNKITQFNTNQMILGTVIYSLLFYIIAYYVFKKKNI
ncbi:ABC transporter permease subunit [Lactobacillus sp. S2-2]|uniref:ABC transporter permease n=1 Tax=Lactobacillus sp. S2-2 TaxID=2692917 RepID=UPI001F353955|nr:ABC transporter permease [Lactobacillus sp. S2-2]MCF6514618.1 ABC transporter permease subunit [Lactobacillus sp. S2-2]